MTYDTHELAWAAGFYDGEGSTSTTMQYNRMNLRFGAAQNDRYVLDRFMAAIGLGRICQRGYNGHCRPFALDLTTHEHVQAAVALLWRWLSPIKREQAASALCKYTAFHHACPAAYPKTHCKRGHEMSAANLYIYPKTGARQCKPCVKIVRATKQVT